MIRTTTTLLLAIVLLASCNQYKKTPSGIAYKISKGSGTEKLKAGQIIKYNVEYRIPPKDSVFSSSYGHIPGYLIVDTSNNNKHSFVELLPLCGVGDKVEFTLSVDTLKKMGQLEYNEFFHQRDQIKGKLEVLKVFKNQQEAQADVQAEVDNEKQRESKELEAAAAKDGAKTVKTRSGALVDVKNSGDPILRADSGKQVKVMFKGSFTNGKVFQTNMDPKGQFTEPMVVNIGAGGVIPGLDEGLRFFGKGGKGRIYIPSMLAYGDKGQPPVIPGYSNMIFDVEVVDVANPPAPAATPGAVPQAPKK